MPSARRNRRGSSWACPAAARSAGAGCATSARPCRATRRHTSRCRRRPNSPASRAIAPFAVSHRPATMLRQHRLPFGVHAARGLADDRDRRELPDTAPRAPTPGRTAPSRCIARARPGRHCANSRRPERHRHRRRVARPVGPEGIGPRRGERDQRRRLLAGVLRADLVVVGGDLGDVRGLRRSVDRRGCSRRRPRATRPARTP